MKKLMLVFLCLFLLTGCKPVEETPDDNEIECSSDETLVGDECIKNVVDNTDYELELSNDINGFYNAMYTGGFGSITIDYTLTRSEGAISNVIERTVVKQLFSVQEESYRYTVDNYNREGLEYLEVFGPTETGYQIISTQDGVDEIEVVTIQESFLEDYIMIDEFSFDTDLQGVKNVSGPSEYIYILSCTKDFLQERTIANINHYLDMFDDSDFVITITFEPLDNQFVITYQSVNTIEGSSYSEIEVEMTVKILDEISYGNLLTE